MSKPTGRQKLCPDESIIELWRRGLNLSQIGRQADLTGPAVRYRLRVSVKSKQNVSAVAEERAS